MDTDELVLQQSLFNTSDYIYWRVIFTVTTHFGEDEFLKSSSTLTLKVNSVPLNGTCEVNINNGTALYTLFTIFCMDWEDTDGRVARYEYLGKPSFFSTWKLKEDYLLKLDFVVKSVSRELRIQHHWASILMASYQPNCPREIPTMTIRSI